MVDEIRGPHDCGIYGHRYYGMTRDHVEFLITVNDHHTSNFTKFIDAMYEDGGLDQETSIKCRDILAELHKMISGSLEKILYNGDEIHNNVS